MPGEFSRVIGVAPSIIDAHYFYDTTSEWHTGLDALNLIPGEWAEAQRISDEQRAALPAPSSMKAGSSILAVMAVLPDEVKRGSILYATSAHDAEGQPAQDSMAFHEDAERLGVSTYPIPLQGENPTVHALIDPSSGEKGFLKTIGVSKDISALPGWEQHLTEDTVVLLDAYELIDGKTSETLRHIIETSKGNVALSLGNVAILGEDLTQFITNAGKQGALHSLFGNEDEFTALLGATPRVSTQLLDAHNTLNAHLVVTRGAEGISATIDGHYYYAGAPQLQAHDMVSTSGAGDAAMGVILGGLIEKEAASTLLHKAVNHCARVVQSAEDIVLR